MNISASAFYGDGSNLTGVKPVARRQTFNSGCLADNDGSAGALSQNLMTASLNISADGFPLTGTLEVYLNGMLQTISASAGAVSSSVHGLIYDYELSGSSAGLGCDEYNATHILMNGAIDSDDVLVVKYLQDA